MNARQRSLSGAVALALAWGAWAAEPAPSVIPAWSVPDIEKLPNDKYGELVRYGKALVERTAGYIGREAADPAMRHAGNNLSCASCHLDGGTRKFANPFIGTFADFPSYRAREDAIGTIEDRINGCMERSMNGRRLPAESRELRAMAAYIGFLSTGIPVGTKVVGRGTPKMKLLDRAADPVRGGAVYAQYCVACHGADGQGVRAADAAGYTFPPLWGPDSYNTGAGMHRVVLAANFIKFNMPQGVKHEAPLLSDEDAFDVSAYINSQARPVKAGLERDFPARFNKPVDAPFPPYRTGFTAEQHKYGPFKPIVEARDREVKSAGR